MIDRQKITAPRMWQLVIEISSSSLHAIAFRHDEEQTLQTLRVDLPATAPTALGALEEAVYNNPALTDDFGRVTVLWRSERFAVMPCFVTDDAIQIDLPVDKVSGLKEAMRVLKGVEDISICQLTGADVVRHVIVQRIIKAYEEDEKRRSAKRR